MHVTTNFKRMLPHLSDATCLGCVSNSLKLIPDSQALLASAGQLIHSLSVGVCCCLPVEWHHRPCETPQPCKLLRQNNDVAMAPQQWVPSVGLQFAFLPLSSLAFKHDWDPAHQNLAWLLCLPACCLRIGNLLLLLPGGGKGLRS